MERKKRLKHTSNIQTFVGGGALPKGMVAVSPVTKYGQAPAYSRHLDAGEKKKKLSNVLLLQQTDTRGSKRL